MKPGDLVGSKYRIVTRLGLGGMGTVWSATHAQTGREFAIKVLHPAVSAGNEEARQRFLQEARASARVNHPNIIDIFDVGESEDGSLYLVMELLEGISLADAFRADPPFSLRELLVLLVGACTALGAAHAAGIIHRDIKPPNIFLHRDRASGLVRPKVLDFGVSKVALDDGVSTQLGSLLGSPRYMAPEQAISATRADGRADLWSVGVILFEALTGEFPHVGGDSNAIVIAIATTPPRSVREVAHPQGAPASLLDLVDDLLRPVAARVQSSEALVERLKAILAESDLSDIPVARPQALKKFVNRPDNFVIQTHAGFTSSLGSVPISVSRMGSIPDGVPGVPRGDATSSVPRVPPPTPSAPRLPPPARPGSSPDEPDAATVMLQSGGIGGAVAGGTLVLTPSANRRSPFAPPDPASSPGADPSESISSINVARGLAPMAPLGPVVDSLPPAAPRPKNRLWLGLGAAGVTLLLGGTVIALTRSSDDSAPAASAAASSAPKANTAAATAAPPTSTTAAATATVATSGSAVASSTAVATSTKRTTPTSAPASTGAQPVKTADPLRDLGSGIGGGKKK